MNLQTFKPLFQDLPFEDRLSIVLNLHANRRISKRPPASERAAAPWAARTKKQPNISTAIAAMSPEEALKLLQQLEALEPQE